MTYRIVLAPLAEDDLAQLRSWIVKEAGREVARSYLERVERKLDTLAAFPNRGTPRPDAGSGIRSIPFERRRVIFYRVDADIVTILRVLDGARDLARLFN